MIRLIISAKGLGAYDLACCRVGSWVLEDVPRPMNVVQCFGYFSSFIVGS